MQTELAAFIRDTPEGREADAILRKCVHCGFCTATCPTYQLLGDELDGPRGRIYLVKQVLEGATPTARTQLHLDRCLTCRACETTCPTGVRYGRIADIGFQGKGCAISVASASLMCEAVKGKLRREIAHLFHEIHEVLTKHDAPVPEDLGKLAALSGVREFPVRVKCASLAWHTLNAALERSAATVQTE